MTQPIDILIVEDDATFTELYIEIIQRVNNFRVVGIATSLQEAKQLIFDLKPDLVLLDNHLPDGRGSELLKSIVTFNLESYVIFITVAGDMQLFSEPIRFGVFDYIVKPIFNDRLEYSLSKFGHFISSKNSIKSLNQRKIDGLFNLQLKDFSEQCKHTKGIDDLTLQSVQDLFTEVPGKVFSAEMVAKELGISKTTARRYLEYCFEIKFLTIQPSYVHIGRPERLYLKT